jgi:hypothetical protein
MDILEELKKIDNQKVLCNKDNRKGSARVYVGRDLETSKIVTHIEITYKTGGYDIVSSPEMFYENYTIKEKIK